jgi:hypothetical protein
VLNSFYKPYQVYTYQIEKNEYQEDVKTRIPYKEVEVAVSYIAHSDYLQNDLKLKEVSHIGFTHDSTLSIGMEVDNYEIVFVLPTGREFVLYLKEIR